MSARQDTNTDLLSSSANIPPVGAISVFGRGNIVNLNPGTARPFFSIDDGAFADYIVLRLETSGVLSCNTTAGSNSVGVSPVAGSWYSWYFTNAGAGAGNLKVGFAYDTDPTFTIVSLPGVAFTAARILFNAINSSNWNDAEVRSLRMWTAVKAAAVFIAERSSFDAVDLANLHTSLRLANAASSGTDFSGNGFNFTSTGYVDGASEPALLVLDSPAIRAKAGPGARGPRKRNRFWKATRSYEILPATYDESVTEAATAADVCTGLQVALNSLTEAVTAAMAIANDATMGVSDSAAGSAGDAWLAVLTAANTLSESGSVAMALADTATCLNSLTEAVTAAAAYADSLAGSTFNESMTESLTAAMALVASVTVQAIAAEAGAVAMALTGLLNANNALTEAGAAAHANVAVLLALATRTEAMTAADSELAALVIEAALSTPGAAADSLLALWTGQAQLLEALVALDQVVPDTVGNEQLLESIAAAVTFLDSTGLLGLVGGPRYLLSRDRTRAFTVARSKGRDFTIARDAGRTFRVSH